MTAPSDGPRTKCIEDFIRVFHDDQPGATPAMMDLGATSRGSSYHLIADDVAVQGGSVLDVACGNGHLLALIRGRLPNSRLCGVDLSAGELDVARRNPVLHEAELFEANARHLPFPAAEFDAVTCHMALMLMPDVHEILAEIRRVLKPGGLFVAVITGGTVNAVFARFREHLKALFATEGRESFNGMGDPRLRDEDTMAPLFAGAGFHHLKVRRDPLKLDLTPEQAAGFMTESYETALLSREGQAALRSALTADYAGLANADGRVEFEMGLFHIAARR